jgi:hypothetical protein
LQKAKSTVQRLQALAGALIVSDTAGLSHKAHTKVDKHVNTENALMYRWHNCESVLLMRRQIRDVSTSVRVRGSRLEGNTSELCPVLI